MPAAPPHRRTGLDLSPSSPEKRLHDVGGDPAGFESDHQHEGQDYALPREPLRHFDGCRLVLEGLNPFLDLVQAPSQRERIVRIDVRRQSGGRSARGHS